MKKIKKLLAIFIIITMFIGFFPTNVRADDDPSTDSGYTETYSEETKELSPAEKAAQEAAELAKKRQAELDNSPKKSSNDVSQAVRQATQPAKQEEGAGEETNAPSTSGTSNDVDGSPALTAGDDVVEDNNATGERVNVTVNFSWKDGDNRDGKRQDVTFHLVGKNEAGKTYSSSFHPSFTVDPNEQSYSLPNGAKKEYDGSTVVWTLTEDTEQIEGYTTEISEPVVDENGNVTFTVTKSHTPERVIFTVQKVWHDNNNAGETRPEKVYAAVYKDGVLQRQTTLNDDNNWTGELKAQKQYKYEDGVEIEYEIRERWASEDATFKANYDPYVIEEVDGIYQIHNSLKHSTLTLTVEKVWDDDSDRDGVRPESVTVNIVGTIEGAADPVVTETLVIEETDNWVGTIDLPRTYEGIPIAYTFTEDEIKDGDTVLYTTTTIDDSGVPASSDEPAQDKTGKLVITNKHEPELVKINVTKVWDDKDDADGKRPDKVFIRIFRNGNYIRQHYVEADSDWKKTIEPSERSGPFYKYYDHGTPYEYTIDESAEFSREDAVPIENYKLISIEGDVENGFTITNQYVPQKTTVRITKVWDDDESTSRPNVLVRLMNNGHEVGTAYLNSTTTPPWSVEFKDIDVFDANGNEIEYNVDEEGIPGYITPSIEKTGSALHGYEFIITNANQTSVTVNKVWDDDDNRDGVRPDTVTVNLLANGEFADSAELSNSNNWTYKFTELPRYIDNQPVEYTIEEPVVEGYESEISGDAKTGFTLTNTHKPEVYDSISVIKEWKDGNNRDGVRPEQVYVRLYKENGEYAGKQKRLSDKNEWTSQFTTSQKAPLYKYENGEEIVYTIVECTNPKGEPVALENYEPVVEGSAAKGFTVTNIHKSELVEITVTKVWDDDNNRDGVRPDEVYAVVYANGEKVRQRALNEANGWTTTIVAEKQYKYEEGQEIVYTVEESWVKGVVTPEDPNGYYEPAVITGNLEEGFTITNTHKPELVEFDVTKVWDDGENRDGFRPDEVYAVVYANGEKVRQRALNEENGWNTTIKAETQYKYENGQEIAYTVEESWVKGVVTPEDPNGKYTATVEGDVENGFTITNTHKPELVEINVNKVWEDEDDTDGFRPDEVYAVVYANDVKVRQRALNDANDWATTIKAETQYKYENGQEIEYTVKESWKKGEVTLEDPNGQYTATVEGDVENGFKITNTHIVERVEHTVTIEWEDDNDRDGVRPDFVKAKLFRDDVEVEGSEVVLSPANGWSHTWTDLLKINSETGQPAVYTVEAEPVKEYEGPIPSNGLLNAPLLRAPGDDLGVDGEGDSGEEGGSDAADTGSESKFKYIHEPELIDITGNKIWKDNDNQDGKRPESITVNIYAGGELIDSVELTAEDATEDENVWEYTFVDLYKYDNGQLIDYWVSEEAIENYTPDIKGFDIYNSYTPEKTFLTVIKLWDDDRDRDGLRADNVIVRLLADGKEINRASLNKTSGWFTIFTDLDVYKTPGQKIQYTIVEDEVKDYKAEITGNQDEGYVVTNSHTPETTSVTLKAEWIDDNNSANERPSSVTVHLLANGEVVATKTLTAAGNWTMTIKDLPKYANGKEIVYTMAQNPISKYNTTVTGLTAYNKLVETPSCPSCKTTTYTTYVIPRTGD